MKALFRRKKYSTDAYCYDPLKRRALELDLDLDRILRQYNGLEGEMDEDFGFFVDERIEPIKSHSGAGVIIVHTDSELDDAEGSWQCVGYDVGTVDKDNDPFSSIFQEALFGRNPELRSFCSELNSNYLFDNVLTARRFLELHKRLESSGHDVEEGDDIQVFRIFVVVY